MKSVLRLSTADSATKWTVAARAASVLTSAQGAWSLTYWLTVEAMRIASPSAARNRPPSICAPTMSNPEATPASSASSMSVRVPGSGTTPKLRCALVSVRLTRLPQFASSSSLLRRTNSAHVKSASWVSGPAAIR